VQYFNVITIGKNGGYCCHMNDPIFLLVYIRNNLFALLLPLVFIRKKKGGFLSALTYCNQSIAKAIDKLLSPSGVKAHGLRGTGFGGWGQLPVGVAIYLRKVILRY
jgi:hypothetical protein